MPLLIYQLFYPLVAAGVLLHLLLAGRGRILREGGRDLRQRLGRPSPEDLKPLAGGKVLWLHAASVGEVTAAEPLLRRLACADRERKLLVTTSTVAGRQRARKISCVDAALLLPVDFYPAVSSFLAAVSPRALILLEKEFWPMTLYLAAKRGVRIGMANGRITRRSAARYALLSPLIAPLLSRIERAAVQTAEDAERLRALGVPPEALLVAGNSKYDLPPPEEEAGKAVAERLARAGFAGRPVWIAGSTRRGEEAEILKAHRLAARAKPGLRLILAPRHPERSGEAAALLREQGLRFARWSEPLDACADPECLLVDALGLLRALYPRSLAAFVGGTLAPVGGHNLLEPAFAGLPVFFGPHIQNTEAVALALTASRGGSIVHDAGELAEALIRCLTDEEFRRKTGDEARRTAAAFVGASQRSLAHLRPLLEG